MSNETPTNLSHPFGDCSCIACRGCGQCRRTSRIISEFPAENGRIVAITFYHVGNIILEGADDIGLRVKVVMCWVGLKDPVVKVHPSYKTASSVIDKRHPVSERGTSATRTVIVGEIAPGEDYISFE